MLHYLQTHEELVIANTDKGLGPCAIELDRYIEDALIHLLDESTYVLLSENEANAEATRTSF